MTNRIDRFNQFMTHQLEGRLDLAVAMLADDVTLTDPMTGTVTGTAAVEAAMRSRPAGAGDMNLTWSEPEVSGDTVKLVGTGGPFPIHVEVTFDTDDAIKKINIFIA